MLISGVPLIASRLKVHDLANPEQTKPHHHDRGDEQWDLVQQYLGVTAVERHHGGEDDKREHDQGPTLQTSLSGKRADVLLQAGAGANEARQTLEHVREVAAGLALA